MRRPAIHRLGPWALVALVVLFNLWVLRAEATLAAANLVWFLLVLGGGIVVALADYPAGLQGPLALLPSAALAEGLRSALNGGGLDGQAVAVLLGWSVAAYGLASRTFRWD